MDTNDCSTIYRHQFNNIYSFLFKSKLADCCRRRPLQTLQPGAAVEQHNIQQQEHSLRLLKVKGEEDKYLERQELEDNYTSM